MPGSSNNIGGVRIATAQSSGQHTTSNDADNALDAALTATKAIGVTNTNLYTMTADELASGFRFEIGNGGTSASANFVIEFPASALRGATFWRNTLAYAATLRKVTSQTAPVVVIPPGGHAVVEYDGSNVRLVSYLTPFEMVVAAGDETTALTTGTAKVTFAMPRAVWITEIYGFLTTAQASGSIFTADFNVGGASILSTVITIDNTEQSSRTAATPAVISAPAIAAGGICSVDIDQVGGGTAKGLKIELIGYRY